MSRKFDFDFAPLNRDDILEMSSDELNDHIVKFKRMIKEARTLGQDTTQFEVEFCYLDHERQMRSRAERIFKQHRRNKVKASAGGR